MENKKTPKADLENKKHLFFETGLIIALATVLFAFEWKSSEAEISDFIPVPEIPLTEIEMPVITTPAPLPPPPAIKPFDLLNIVDDVNEIDATVDLVDATNDTPNPATDFDPNSLNYDNADTGEDDAFIVVEEPPVFPGNIHKWLAQNVHYPALAEANGIEGKVFVKFVIERDGSVSNIEILRGADNTLDKEAVRVVSAMPKWKPGKQRHKAVRVSYTLPISFRLTK